MLIFNDRQIRDLIEIEDLNTSHVNLQLLMFTICIVTVLNLNTSHVNLQQAKDFLRQ